MPQITIREQRLGETEFAATVTFNHQTEFSITVTDPFTPEEEARLEWFFESWLVMPLLQTTTAEAARLSVRWYGENLFEQVFGDRKVYQKYGDCRGKETQIEITGSPEFQALHWEAMCDPELPRPLAVEWVMVRKALEPVAMEVEIAESPLIRLLVVTARPDEEKDVGYRTISRPLLEAIAQSKLQVEVDLLRPGTYEALSRQLEEKGANYYHIVHLDLHGALMTYEQVQNPGKPGRYLYRVRFGRSDLQPFEGVRAFLVFEGEEAGQVDLVEAGEFVDLLMGKGIPVCILNACQSGKQVKGAGGQAGQAGEAARETSLGARLMAAGLQTVVAMGYSVTVTAAALLMETLYGALFERGDLAGAIRRSRRSLWDNKDRRAYFNQVIQLEDWLLPVVYANGTVDFRLRSFGAEEEEQYWAAQERRVRFVEPTYGFVGRDLEILKIEKGLLRRNVLLLQGMGGTGKTTLLRYLQDWWVRTRFAEDVFYFGYDLKAWTLEQIADGMAQRMYDKFELGRWRSFEMGARVAKLVAELRSHSYVLILDNLESVTGQRLAIQNTLAVEEQGVLREFLLRLVGGKTKVVLGSRSEEGWLNAVVQQDVYILRGLDGESRTELADKILRMQVREQGRIEAIRQDGDFGRLMKLLAGYPLAMEVVLGNLRTQSAGEILGRLDAADVALDTGSGDKTESILKCVEYSHSNLSVGAQELLVCLAPFSGFIYRAFLPQYVEQLQKLEPLRGLELEGLDGAVEEAIGWGLLSPIDELNPQLLTIQPVLPYFLKTKLRDWDEARRGALEEGFKAHYWRLSANYNQLMESKNPQERQTGIIFCELEYENLYRALKICLAKQEGVNIFSCLDTYLRMINDPITGLQLVEFVCQKVEQYSTNLNPSQVAKAMVISCGQRAQLYENTQQLVKAKDSYHRILEVLASTKGLDKHTQQAWAAGSYHNLGSVVQKMRQHEEAEALYKKALGLFIDNGDHFGQAGTYQYLGDLAQEMQQNESAERYYHQALDIHIKHEDRYGLAKAYQGLGSTALDGQQYEKAQRYYQQSLEIYIEYEDHHNQASVLNNLGLVAQGMKQYEEANSYHQQALSIWIGYGNRSYQSVAYYNLSLVAQALRQYEEAKCYCQQVLKINIEDGDRHNQADTYYQPGRIAKATENYAEARSYFQQSMTLFMELGDEHSIAIVQRCDRLLEWEAEREKGD